MKILYFLLVSIISTSSFASPLLYIKVKDNNVCAFTKSKVKEIYKNQVLIYIGKIDEINAFHDSYSKKYLNLKVPIVESNCITIPASEFQENEPYDIVLETDKSYARRICLKKDANNSLQLLGVENGYSCKAIQYDYSSNSFFSKLKNLYYWLASFFN